jgi:quinol monooxygenase YgiN
MYGTIARMQTLPGALEAIRVMEARRPAGFVASYVYQMDANESELWMVVIFESQAAYAANAASPEQNAEYLAVRKLLSQDPDWHDGKVVFDSGGMS